jgi:hypothetical protein
MLSRYRTFPLVPKVRKGRKVIQDLKVLKESQARKDPQDPKARQVPRLSPCLSMVAVV